MRERDLMHSFTILALLDRQCLHKFVLSFHKSNNKEKIIKQCLYNIYIIVASKQEKKNNANLLRTDETPRLTVEIRCGVTTVNEIFSFDQLRSYPTSQIPEI
ncbi:hypothetical protein HS088_TW14G00472 [Tripterygium wilfordii]|uniref:Uncharacterized protein n=1 Tax=Tripterygium wilfordii TaxID=458696 RepID=A0A7J7CQJ6_TRIWF|nr:hypothetical protein HS088_TW14G00472 [Tripterygium wilfordii]